MRDELRKKKQISHRFNTLISSLIDVSCTGSHVSALLCVFLHTRVIFI